MPLSVSETSLVSNVSPVYLENSEIVLKDDLGDSSLLDVEEYRCTNRELVNLENAAVNIDNSNDVIIGPVTQFNVSGNVTIYQNGGREQEAINETVINQGQEPTDKPADGGFKTKVAILSYCFKILYINKHNLRNLGLVLLVLLIFTVTALILIVKLKTEDEDYDYDYKENDYGNQVEEHYVFYRKDWNGKPPKKNLVKLQHPVSLVIISHSTTHPCDAFHECAEIVKQIQTDHFSNPFNSVDIGYNFMIGGDGNIYVGRGWDIENFHRKNSIGINFIGNFNYDKLYPGMISAAKLLIKQGVALKKLSQDYVLVGENQTNSKMYLSPGVNVYEIIKHWPNFYNKTML